MTSIMEREDIRILTVEDDPVIAGAIEKKLRSWNYRALSVHDFSRVLEEFREFQPHLVLMDVSLPEFSGYYWCERIRAVSRVPILFLSSNEEKSSQMLAMSLGADDYMTKPFDLDILISKIQAMLRRSYDFSARSSELAIGELVLDLDGKILRFRDSSLELSRNEFHILQLLMEQDGKVVSRERLMEKLWNTEQFVDDNTLSVNVNRLRRKLERIRLQGLIQTRPSLGYILDYGKWKESHDPF